MRKAIIGILFLFASAAFAQEPVTRWCNAAGGRDKVAQIKSIYREATVDVGGMSGTIKAWHTADGKYRKEEQVGPYVAIETFDGANGSIQRGDDPPQSMAAADLERARSARYANANAMFFAFFPERRKGNLAIEDDGTVVLKPEGGVDWRITLDPETSLPKTMVHKEGERTITVTFISYETVDGLKLEKEIHRTIGDPRYDAVIKFTKTVINPELSAAMFSIEPKKVAASK